MEDNYYYIVCLKQAIKEHKSDKKYVKELKKELKALEGANKANRKRVRDAIAFSNFRVETTEEQRERIKLILEEIKRLQDKKGE